MILPASLLTVLHILDVYMTLSVGGLVAEGNPIAVLLWSNFGLAPIILAKLLSIVFLVIAWIYFDSVPCTKLFRSILCVGLIGIQGFILVCNYTVMGAY